MLKPTLIAHIQHRRTFIQQFYHGPRKITAETANMTPTVAIIMGTTTIKHSVPDRVKPSFVIFDIRALSSERQSARMSKITNDSLTRSGTRCFI